MSNHFKSESIILLNFSIYHLLTIYISSPSVGFDENEIGCVVKKVFDNGNSVKSAKGDLIKVGDHLASINGTNVYKKSVTEICNILAGCENTDEIQLTFLRYIGPIRNSHTNEQQGYEVIDPHVEKKGTSSPLKLSKKLSNVKGESSAQEDKQELASSPSKKIATHDNDARDSQQSLIPNCEDKSTNNDNIEGKMKKISFSNAEGKQKDNQTNSVEKDTKISKKKRGFGFFRRRRDNKKKNTT